MAILTKMITAMKIWMVRNTIAVMLITLKMIRLMTMMMMMIMLTMMMTMMMMMMTDRWIGRGGRTIGWL